MIFPSEFSTQRHNCHPPCRGGHSRHISMYLGCTPSSAGDFAGIIKLRLWWRRLNNRSSFSENWSLSQTSPAARQILYRECNVYRPFVTTLPVKSKNILNWVIHTNSKIIGTAHETFTICQTLSKLTIILRDNRPVLYGEIRQLSSGRRFCVPVHQVEAVLSYFAHAISEASVF